MDFGRSILRKPIFHLFVSKLSFFFMTLITDIQQYVAQDIWNDSTVNYKIMTLMRKS